MTKKILVPIDLEHKSSWAKALPSAADQAKVLGGKVWVMTVVPHIVGGLDWRYAIRGEEHGSLKLDIKEMVAQAEVRLKELAKEHIPKGSLGGVIAKHGTVYEQVVQTSEEMGIDLIVMAAHRPSLKDYLIGPNTARVARHANCSVQIVRD